ncbi:MAG: hypothetical protein WBF48_01610 [Halarcobacter sp.]
MSMSQEEIESLMNGLDIDDNDDNEVSEEINVEEPLPQGNMSEDDINALISQTQEITSTNESSSSEESVEDLLNSLKDTEDIETSADETNIDDILKELEENETVEDVIEIPEDIMELDTNTSDEVTSVVPDEPKFDTSLVHKNTNDNYKRDIDNKIDNGLFPLPVENDTKVVNQLSEVASDSEEKATKIFDVLSNILDYNNAIQSDVKALSSFNEKQIAMLNSLSQKFPNIDIFKENLNQAQEMGNYIEDANEKVNSGNTEIFQAMELMQYHDINRQKIERVMSVIRKLSSYLNNLFEDEGNRQEVNVANHIHGDSTDDLLGNEDLESLIAEFNK